MFHTIALHDANFLFSAWSAASVALAQPSLIIQSSAERRSPTFARPSKRRSYFGATFSDRHSRKNSKGESGRGVKRPESGSFFKSFPYFLHPMYSFRLAYIIMTIQLLDHQQHWPQPNLFTRFYDKLASSDGYDVVVDGLNVALARFPGVKMNNFHQQSLSVSLAIVCLEIRTSLKTFCNSCRHFS